MELMKLTGAGLIFAASVWAGSHGALRLRRTDEQLRDLTAALELMAGEIAFAATPFVPLCKKAEAGRCREVRAFFSELAGQARHPELPAEGRTRFACRRAGLILPEPVTRSLERLFDSFGSCDREGQLRQLSLTSEALKRLSAELSDQITGKCRSFRWLGFAAGAAMLVLLI